MTSTLLTHLIRPKIAIPFTLIVLLILIVSLLPMVIESQAKQWVHEHGGEDFSVENIDFNPFTLNLKLEQLVIKHKGKKTLLLPELELHSSWMRLFDRTLLIEELTIYQLEVDIANLSPDTAYAGGILLNLLNTSEQKNVETSQSEPWHIEIRSLALRQSTLKYLDSKLDIKLDIDSFTMSGLESKEQQRFAKISLEGMLNNAKLSLHGTTNPFAERSEFKGKIKLEKLQLSDFTNFIKPRLSSIKGLANLDSKLWLQYGASQPISVVQTGALKLDSFAITDTSKDIELGFSSLTWQGDVNLENNQPDVKGQLQLHALQSNTISDQISIMAIDEIEVLGLELAGNNHIQTDKVIINELHINPTTEQSALLSNNQFIISQLLFSDETGLRIEELSQDGVTITVNKQDFERWNYSTFANRLQTLFVAESETVKTSTESKPLDIYLGQYNLTNGQVNFTDETTEPLYKTVIEVQDGKLSTIDSRQSEQATQLLLNATMDKKSVIEIQGDLHLFAADNNVNLTTKITGIAMPALSSYTGKMIGYDMNSGELDIDSTLEIKADNVDSKNNLKLYHLEVSALEQKRLEQLGVEPISSLETGLSLLRDSNNTITLDLPVKGTLGDVSVNPSDIISQAIGSALKTGAKTYLMTALFPFGTLLVIADSVTDSAMKVDLDPIIFSDNSSSLNEQNHSYLQKIANILKQRPELHLKVCALSTESDKQAMLANLIAERSTQNKAAANTEQEKTTTVVIPEISDAALISLAEKRAKIIDDYLLVEEGIKGNRLISCKASFDLESTAKPRVDLQF